MARYDCFMFFNELDVLEVRLNELQAHIDIFVLVEAPWTFQGAPKPLYFAENRKRFRHFGSKIRHVVLEAPPATNDPWQREDYQRSCIMRGLADARPSDTIVISDADEIPRPGAIAEAERIGNFCFLEMDLFYYYFDWRAHPWLKVYAAPFSRIAAMHDLSEPRRLEELYLGHARLDAGTHIIRQAGWHFSWLGGVQCMIQKLEAFSHTEPEIQRWKNKDDLRKALESRKFFVGNVPLSTVDINVLPKTIQRKAKMYFKKGLLHQRPPTFVQRLLRRSWIA